jgi:hypothetical protein
MAQKNILFIFTNDLRVVDNTAWNMLPKSKTNVIPIVLLPNFANPRAKLFYLNCLNEFKKQIEVKVVSRMSNVSPKNVSDVFYNQDPVHTEHKTRIEEWCEKNKLTIHASTTDYTLYRTKNFSLPKHIRNDPQLTVKIWAYLNCGTISIRQALHHFRKNQEISMLILFRVSQLKNFYLQKEGAGFLSFLKQTTGVLKTPVKKNAEYFLNELYPPSQPPSDDDLWQSCENKINTFNTFGPVVERNGKLELMPLKDSFQKIVFTKDGWKNICTKTPHRDICKEECTYKLLDSLHAEHDKEIKIFFEESKRKFAILNEAYKSLNKQECILFKQEHERRGLKTSQQCPN